MAGRKGKNIVDYFPHYCNHGKTIYILEQKYKSDGYTAWFKVLEKLGSTENHYIDCRNDADWEFLQASIPLMQTELSKILDLLAKLEAIHPELWEKKIIWSGKFIQNIEDAYKRRNDLCMHFDDLCKHLSIKCKHEYDIYGIIVNKKEQSKVEYSKVNKSKEDLVKSNIELYKKWQSESENDNYRFFVDYILKLNHTGEPLKYCLQLKGQITEQSFKRLYEIMKKNGTKMTDKIVKIEEKLLATNGKSAKDLNLTLGNWLQNKFTK